MSERLRLVDPIDILKDLVSSPSYMRGRSDGSYESDERQIGEYICDFIRTHTLLRVDVQGVLDKRLIPMTNTLR